MMIDPNNMEILLDIVDILAEYGAWIKTEDSKSETRFKGYSKTAIDNRLKESDQEELLSNMEIKRDSSRGTHQNLSPEHTVDDLEKNIGNSHYE